MRRSGTHRREGQALAILVCAVVALVVLIVGWTFSSPRSSTKTATQASDANASPGVATSASMVAAPNPAPSPASVSAWTAASAPRSTVASGQSSAQSAGLPTKLPADAVKVHAPILMYHYVDATPPPAGPYADSLTVRTKDFKAEMEYLANHNYHTVNFADVYLAMCGKKELPARSVVLTFDDGGLDNYEVAFPILKEYGFTGTFFVITRTVGREGQMSWEQLREMAAAGMSIQSHTVTHPDLRAVSASRLQSELMNSRQAITEELGEPPYVLAYPSGAYNDTVIAATRSAGYLMAVATSKGEEGNPKAVYEIKRRRVQAFLPVETFAGLLR